MMGAPIIITVDGPTASGKSTVAHMVAERLSYLHLNSGLLFRELAYALVTTQHYTVEQLATAPVTAMEPFFSTLSNYQYGFVPVPSSLMTSVVATYASLLGTNEQARLFLTKVQRVIGKRNNCVVDGRDSGSFVFPRAAYKFFLTASVEVRAQRLYERLGKQEPYNVVLARLQERDERDSTRSHAPLVVPVGACIIDTTVLTACQVCDAILSIIKDKKAGNA